MSEEVNK